MSKCICCKVSNTGKTSMFCDNCWSYMMPEKNHKGKKLEWGDIWMLVAHWHAIHDEKDKNFDFAHDVVLTAYSHDHYHRPNGVKLCLEMEPSDDILCELEKGHSGKHAVFWK